MGCTPCNTADAAATTAKPPPLILQLMPEPPEKKDDQKKATPPDDKRCECPFHWCCNPDCPHTCLYKKCGSGRRCCCLHWFVPLCPPANTSPCPPTPCPAEDPAELGVKYAAPSSWAAPPKEEPEAHGACWCNAWKSGLQKSKPTPATAAKKKCKDTRIKSKAQRQREEEEREDLFPPPPDTLCSYKPVVMDMRAPAAEGDAGWKAVPQPCKKKTPARAEEKPCTRNGCLHYQPRGVCLYDEPCKADCFNHPPGMKPYKYPNGFPNYADC